MARARNPNRDRAYELWKERGGQITNRELAAVLGENEKKIAVWKQRDKWSVVQQTENIVQQEKDCRTTKEPKKKRGGQPGNGNAKGHGAPKGNKNALGNHGGAPKGNKNALVSGKYERIWYDCLGEDEIELCENLNTDELDQINQEIELLTIRERRMMQRIKIWADKKEDIEERITQVTGASTLLDAVYDAETGQMRDSSATAFVPKELIQMKRSALDKLLKIERHLTDIQAKKTRAIEIKHRIMMIRNPTGSSENLAKGLDPLDAYSKEELMEILGDG